MPLLEQPAITRPSVPVIFPDQGVLTYNHPGFSMPAGDYSPLTANGEGAVQERFDWFTETPLLQRPDEKAAVGEDTTSNTERPVPNHAFAVPGNNGEPIIFNVVRHPGQHRTHNLEQATTCLWALNRAMERSRRPTILDRSRLGTLEMLNRAAGTAPYNIDAPLFPSFASKEREVALSALVKIYSDPKADPVDRLRAADTARSILTDTLATH